MKLFPFSGENESVCIFQSVILLAKEFHLAAGKPFVRNFSGGCFCGVRWLVQETVVFFVRVAKIGLVGRQASGRDGRWGGGFLHLYQLPRRERDRLRDAMGVPVVLPFEDGMDDLVDVLRAQLEKGKAG